MPLLTIFTPCSNGAATLQRTYKSLKEQSCKNFVWMIIDNGSNDDTKQLATKWVDEQQDFKIKYIYKNAGGQHTAWNKAIELADTELMMCVVSNNYLPKDAVQQINNLWLEKGSKEVGGIVGFNSFVDEIVTNVNHYDSELVKLHDIHMGGFEDNGNEAYVIRTTLLKAVAPMPEYEGESYFSPYSLILRIAREYEFLLLNENICFLGNIPEKEKIDIYCQMKENPNGFAEMLLLNLAHPNADTKFILKQSMLYNSCCMLAKRKDFVKKSPHKRLTALTMPASVFMKWYILAKGKHKADNTNDKILIFK
jgi:glycosyltransferase involved in cell wall biosynthesis